MLNSLAVFVVSLAGGRWLGVLATIGITVALGGFALWRSLAFDTRVQARKPR